MTEQQACTLCGAGGHSAAQCNWNQCETMQRPKSECGCPDCGSSLIDVPAEEVDIAMAAEARDELRAMLGEGKEVDDVLVRE